MFLGLTVLDYLLIVLFISYAFTGFKQGLVVSVLSLAGFLTGGALAMWLVPMAMEQWTDLESSPLLRAVVLIAGVFILASAGQALSTSSGPVTSPRKLVSTPGAAHGISAPSTPLPTAGTTRASSGTPGPRTSTE